MCSGIDKYAAKQSGIYRNCFVCATRVRIPAAGLRPMGVGIKRARCKESGLFSINGCENALFLRRVAVYLRKRKNE